MPKQKRIICIISFAIVFFISLFFVLKSGDFAKKSARQYIEPNVYTTSETDVRRNLASYLTAGAIVTLLSGAGLVISIIKD